MRLVANDVSTCGSDVAAIPNVVKQVVASMIHAYSLEACKSRVSGRWGEVKVVHAREAHQLGMSYLVRGHEWQSGHL